MKKNVNMKIAIPVMVGILVLFIVLKSLGLITFRSGTRIGFAGNDGIHIFNGSYYKITGTSTHTLRPSKDSDSIHCTVTTESGTLHVLIVQKDDDNVLFDREISGSETFDVASSGKVKITLSTEGHSGSYRFEY